MRRLESKLFKPCKTRTAFLVCIAHHLECFELEGKGIGCVKLSPQQPRKVVNALSANRVIAELPCGDADENVVPLWEALGHHGVRPNHRIRAEHHAGHHDDIGPEPAVITKLDIEGREVTGGAGGVVVRGYQCAATGDPHVPAEANLTAVEGLESNATLEIVQVIGLKPNAWRAVALGPNGPRSPPCPVNSLRNIPLNAHRHPTLHDYSKKRPVRYSDR